MRVLEVVEYKEEQLNEFWGIIPAAFRIVAKPLSNLAAMPAFRVKGVNITVGLIIDAVMTANAIPDLLTAAKRINADPTQISVGEWASIAIDVYFTVSFLKGASAAVKESLKKAIPADVTEQLGQKVKENVLANVNKGAAADKTGVSVTQKPVRTPDEIADMKAKGFDPATGKKIDPTIPAGEKPLKTQAQAAADRFKEAKR
jgi:hypothetical protein